MASAPIAKPCYLSQIDPPAENSCDILTPNLKLRPNRISLLRPILWLCQKQCRKRAYQSSYRGGSFKISLRVNFDNGMIECPKARCEQLARRSKPQICRSRLLNLNEALNFDNGMIKYPKARSEQLARRSKPSSR